MLAELSATALLLSGIGAQAKDSHRLASQRTASLPT